MAQPMGWTGDGGTAHGDGRVMVAQPMGMSDNGTSPQGWMGDGGTTHGDE